MVDEFAPIIEEIDFALEEQSALRVSGPTFVMLHRFGVAGTVDCAPGGGGHADFTRASLTKHSAAAQFGVKDLFRPPRPPAPSSKRRSNRGEYQERSLLRLSRCQRENAPQANEKCEPLLGQNVRRPTPGSIGPCVSRGGNRGGSVHHSRFGRDREQQRRVSPARKLSVGPHSVRRALTLERDRTSFGPLGIRFQCQSEFLLTSETFLRCYRIQIRSLAAFSFHQESGHSVCRS